MIDDSRTNDRFLWWLPICAPAGALLIFVPIILWSYDLGDLLFLFIASPLVVLTLLFVAFRKSDSDRRQQSASVYVAAVVYCAVAWMLLRNGIDVRSDARWLLWSGSYKRQLLAQAEPADGELRHIEWDGWGFAGIDTTVYLIFDPTNSLNSAAKTHSPGKFGEIPCEVPAVHRLQSGWYWVMFYTDTSWEHCQ